MVGGAGRTGRETGSGNREEGSVMIRPFPASRFPAPIPAPNPLRSSELRLLRVVHDLVVGLDDVFLLPFGGTRRPGFRAPARALGGLVQGGAGRGVGAVQFIQRLLDQVVVTGLERSLG